MSNNKLKTKKFMHEIADAIMMGTFKLYLHDKQSIFNFNNGNCYHEINSADVLQFINQAVYVMNKCNFG